MLDVGLTGALGVDVATGGTGGVLDVDEVFEGRSGGVVNGLNFSVLISVAVSVSLTGLNGFME